jgi:DNA-binding beta-propeller fold protein YncE
MTPRASFALAAALAAALALPAAASAVAGKPGKLAQLPGASGCVTEAAVAGCADGRGLNFALANAPGALAGSPDGRHLYTAANATAAIAVLDLDPATGAATPRAGTGGCIQNSGGSGCADGRAIDQINGIAVSPDGRNAYTASVPGVGVFDRNEVTGQLEQKSGTGGCLADSAVDGCLVALTGYGDGTNVAVSPDGENVYVTTKSGANFGTVVVLDRDRVTGALTQKSGTDGCVADDNTVSGATTCADGVGLNDPRSVTVSRDGANVYVASILSDAIAVFDRDPVSGKLTQKPGADGCIADNTALAGLGGCTDALGLARPQQLALSPDGQSAYVAAFNSDALAAFDRDPATGELTQKPGGSGCLANVPTGPLVGCSDVLEMSGPASVAVAPDGESVYVAARTTDSIAVFNRSPDGGVAQKPAPDGCLDSPVATVGCSGANQIVDPIAVVAAPDGKSVHVAAELSDAVTTFRRDVIPVCTSSTTVVGHNEPALIPLSCSDPNGDAITLQLGGFPSHGGFPALIDQAKARITYVPFPPFAGTDTFVFRATANGVTSADAVATAEVMPGIAPVCATDSQTVAQDTGTSIGLSCAADGDPVTFEIFAEPEHGTLSDLEIGNGRVTYTPDPGYTGPDVFFYRGIGAFGLPGAVPVFITVVPQQQGPAGANGAPGSAGPPGARGPTGPPAFKLLVALFEARLKATAGKSVAVRYVATRDAAVTLDVLQGSKRVARVAGRAKTGANRIAWNGKIGRKAAKPGTYRLLLTAKTDDQTATGQATVTASRAKKKTRRR